MVVLHQGTPQAKDLTNIRGLIFDCDGVLFDTRDVNRHYYNHILMTLGLEPMSREDEEYSFMHTVDAAITRIIPEHLRQQARKVQDRMVYNDFLARMIPEPGLVELLQALKDKGILMAINTNRKNSMELVLERFDLTHYFYPVMTAAKVARPKPDPEGVHQIIQAWGLPTSELAYLGDSDVDQATTANAGVPFWAYKNRSLQAELYVDNFHQLQHCFTMGFCTKID